jgi:hypothetical protein
MGWLGVVQPPKGWRLVYDIHRDTLFIDALGLLVKRLEPHNGLAAIACI